MKTVHGLYSRVFSLCLLPLFVLGAEKAPPKKPADLYVLTNVWTVHFTFTPDQWEAIEPKQAGNRGFGRPGGPGGPGGFGPGMFVAPAFLKEGDRNGDGQLSHKEFDALAEKWFASWDKAKKGKIGPDDLRNGLSSVLMPPNAPGGPRGIGMNLQGREGARNGLASAMGIEFNYVQADIDFDGTKLRKAGVRFKGNGTFMQSRGSEKHSFKVDLNHFVEGQKFAGVTKLNFHNNVTDASWMNEVLSHRLFREAGVPAARTAFARVYVTVPGTYEHKYFGLYSMVEDIDKNFAQERFGTKKGAIFKPVTPALFDYLGDDWKKYNQTYDPKTDLSEAQKKRVIAFARFVAQAPEAEFNTRLGEFLDLEEFPKFMAVTVWLSTLDSLLGPGQNYYLYLNPKSNKFQFMAWDLDHSFGQFMMMGSQTDRDALSIRRPWRGENRFLERVFKSDSFLKPYLADLKEFSETIFKPERFQTQVDELARVLRPAIAEEAAGKLARFDQVVAGKSVEPVGFGGGRMGPGGPPPDRGEQRGPPTDQRDNGRFGGPRMQPVKPIKSFVTVRAQSVKDQLAGKSEGSVIGNGFGPGGGGPGGPPNPGTFLGRAFMTALDANKDNEIDREEFTRGFGKWFQEWNTSNSDSLTEDELRAGINRDLGFQGGPPGGPGGSGRGPGGDEVRRDGPPR